MVNVFASPCPVCYDYRCLQEHGWCHMDDGVLFQTMLNVFEEMVRRSSNARVPYPGGPGMMDSPAQYIYSQDYHPMMYPPAFDARGSFGAKDMDMLTARLGNAYITPPLGSASVSGQQGGGGWLSEYDVLAPWQEGYASVPQVAEGGDEDIHYVEQHVNFPAEPPPVPTAPSPVPSISVIEHLEQGTYRHKQVVKGTSAGPVYFNDSEGQGVSLGSLATLANGDDLAFEVGASIGEKASIRFELPQFPGHSIQVRVRHGDKKGRDGRPFTLREMGDAVFDVLRKLMDHAERSGDPLRHGGSIVDIERVVLLRLDQVSKGSIQPILGIRKNR